MFYQKKKGLSTRRVQYTTPVLNPKQLWRPGGPLSRLQLSVLGHTNYAGTDGDRALARVGACMTAAFTCCVYCRLATESRTCERCRVLWWKHMQNMSYVLQYNFHAGVLIVKLE